MSFLNSGIDVTNFMGDSFDTGMAVNARNRADAYKKAGAAKRAGDLAGEGSSLFGKYKGKSLLADAGAYAQQQQANASMFGNIADLAGSIGGFAAMGGFGKFGTGSTGGVGETFKAGDVSKYGDVVQNPMDSFKNAGITGPIYDMQVFP